MTSLYQSVQFPASLDRYISGRILEERDVRAIAVVVSLANVQIPDLAWVALSLVLASPRSGHSCLDLESMSLWAPDHNPDSALGWSTDPQVWLDALTECGSLVCGSSEVDEIPRRPFVLDGHLLYAARSHDEEVRVSEYLRRNIAAKRIEIITGGPGSGKTTSVAQRLVQRFMDPEHTDEKIALAAPTGLAAKRMAKAIRSAIRSQKPSPELEKLIDDLPKLTIHKLLSYNPSAKIQYRFNVDNQLPYDLVIIDEVSMMPLSMMARVLEAMKPEALLILVGDPFQLASVDAGTVLADIVEASQQGVSFVETLSGNFRFPDGSPVGELSTATKAGDFLAALKVLQHEHVATEDTHPRLRWVDPVASPAHLKEVASQVVEHARLLCAMATTARSTEEHRAVIAQREKLQVVCAHRKGSLGVSGWNTTVERQLGSLAQGQWYLGRPVMVTINDSFTNLSNGDIGVVCMDSSGNRVVVFGDSEEIRVFPVARVPQVETVHALTIHKSQGSEYEHTIVVLPKRASRILTRELLYTGMTRAKPHLTLVATEEVLKMTVETQVQRATGLARRLL